MQSDSNEARERSSQPRVLKLRRNAVRIQIAVALAIVFSICTLLYAIAHDSALASLKLSASV